MVGYSETASGTQIAFRTAPNSPINPATDALGTLGGPSISVANDINESGQVVGDSVNTRIELHAFRTAPNSPINRATDDLGTLGGTGSRGFGINKSGQVVGSSSTLSGETHAFRTAANSQINPETDDLGTLGGTESRANGINKSGQVVGYSSIATGENHGFLYDVSGNLVDLNSLISPDSPSNFSVLTSATSINALGQIVGLGIIDGQTHAFLATPVNTDEVTTQSSDSPAKD